MKTLDAPKKIVLRAPEIEISVVKPTQSEEEKYVDEMGERLLEALNRGSQLAIEENERLGLVPCKD